jgi:hypothetical protein
LQAKGKNLLHRNTMMSKGCSARNNIRAKGVMIIGYKERLVAIIIADIAPLPAGPAPTTIPVRGIGMGSLAAIDRDMLAVLAVIASLSETPGEY